MTEQRAIAIEELPELETAVAVHGVAEQDEVGGAICINLAIATQGGGQG